MRLMSISNSPEKILKVANLFNGGWADIHNSQTSIGLSMIYFLSQVRISSPVQWSYLKLIYHNVGSAVAVKQIFSGGRDTISLHRASLVPNTIQVLMLVKQHFRLACIALQTDYAL